MRAVGRCQRTRSPVRYSCRSSGPPKRVGDEALGGELRPGRTARGPRPHHRYTARRSRPPAAAGHGHQARTAWYRRSASQCNGGHGRRQGRADAPGRGEGGALGGAVAVDQHHIVECCVGLADVGPEKTSPPVSSCSRPRRSSVTTTALKSAAISPAIAGVARRWSSRWNRFDGVTVPRVNRVGRTEAPRKGELLFAHIYDNDRIDIDDARRRNRAGRYRRRRIRPPIGRAGLRNVLMILTGPGHDRAADDSRYIRRDILGHRQHDALGRQSVLGPSRGGMRNFFSLPIAVDWARSCSS